MGIEPLRKWRYHPQFPLFLTSLVKKRRKMSGA